MDGGQNWQVFNIPPEGGIATLGLTSTGFICIFGNHHLYFSQSGGGSWQAPEYGFDTDLSDVFFTTDQKLFVAGINGLIKRSADLGDTWEDIQLGTSNNLNDIFFIDQDHGWVCGNSGALYYTIDGGDSWVFKGQNLFVNIFSILFVNNQTGFFSGNYGRIYKTVDGGNTWFELNPGVDFNLNDMSFVDEQNGWFCGSGGQILKTMDGGVSFQISQSPFQYSLSSIWFVDNLKGWLVNNRYIYHTSDGGDSWALQFSDAIYPKVSLNNVFFADTLQGWACGSHGIVMHTVNGGVNWIKQHTGFEYKLNSFFCNSDYEAFAAGDDGVVPYTSDADKLTPLVLDQSQNTVLCEGEDVSLFVDAIGENLNCQWVDAYKPIEGANESTLNFSSVTALSGSIYHCEISNNAGSVSSDFVMLSVKPYVDITGFPVDTLVFVNDTLNLIISASGAMPFS